MNGDKDPNAPPAPDDTRFGAIANERGAFVKEMDNNPDLKRLLMQSVYAEVGNHSPRMQQVYLESVMNRALARKQTLYQTITDPHYYPATTLNQLGADKPASPTDFTPAISSVLGGSNVAKFATGNQGVDAKTGKRVLSGGATITIPHETDLGDDIIIENQDQDWANQKTQQQTQVKAQGQPTTPDVGPVNALKNVAPRAQPAAPRALPAHPLPAHPIAEVDTDDEDDPAYHWPDA